MGAVWEEMILNGLDCLLVMGDDRTSGQGDANARYLAQTNGLRDGTVVIVLWEGNACAVRLAAPTCTTNPCPVYQGLYGLDHRNKGLEWLKPVVDNIKRRMGYGAANHWSGGFKTARGPMRAISSPASSISSC